MWTSLVRLKADRWDGYKRERGDHGNQRTNSFKTDRPATRFLEG